VTAKDEGEADKNYLCQAVRKGSGIRGTVSGVEVRYPGSGVRGPGSGVRGPGSGVRGLRSGVRGPGLVYVASQLNGPPNQTVAYVCVFLGSITFCRWNKLTFPVPATLQLTVSLSYLDCKLDRPLEYPNPLSAAELETALFSILDTKIAVGCKCSSTV